VNDVRDTSNDGSAGAGDGDAAEGEDLEVVELTDDDVEFDDVVDTELVDGIAQPAEFTDEAPETDPLTAAIAQRDEYLDSLRRLQAEFENYRKRVTKQQADQVARAAISLVDKLLPALDALDLAAAHLGDAESDDARALVAATGLLNNALVKEGLERIDPEGEAFDPNAHEAVGHLADEGELSGDDPQSGPVVAQVMRPGYRWRGAVVRPAMVMVRG
jgi:molecular chaperone GrpE